MGSGVCREVAERLELVRLIRVRQMTRAEAARQLGRSPEWARKWWRRFRRGGEAALAPAVLPCPGPLARFSPRVAAAILTFRQTHPLLGARRARMTLEQDADLQGDRLASPSTIHRAWVHAGVMSRRLPRDVPAKPPALPPTDLHGVWEIDHQDHIRVKGLDTLLVLQSIRAPRAGLYIGADLFLGPRGAQGVPEDDLFDALRRRLAQWGRPLALSVDGGLRFLGQPERQFPSRLELLCAGLGIAVVPIRPGRPTDHASIERQHWTLDGILLGVDYTACPLSAIQALADQHLTDLNTRFPSRARPCGGLPPLVAHPQALHSGRPYDPLREWEEFDLTAVDRLLADWRWHRLVGAQTGQISFASHNVGVGKAWADQIVALRFDPSHRQVVIYEAGHTPNELGPEIKRFHCPAFDKVAIIGNSQTAIRPTPRSPVRANDTNPPQRGGTTL
jgi:transposase-like protein